MLAMPIRHARQRLEELQHLAPSEPLPGDDLVDRVDPVNLKYVLGDIQADRRNLHVDGSPNVDLIATITVWHLDAGSGRRFHHSDSAMTACPR